MRCIGTIGVALFAICCMGSSFAYSRLSVDEVISRINRAPHSSRGRLQDDGDRRGRIVGGVKTTIEDVPYQVSVRYFNNHICGGSIISHWWVLTAAHCLDWQPNNVQISIRSGSSSRANGGTLHAVFFYHLHPDYDKEEFQWDVATVRVRTPMVGPGRVSVPLTTTDEWSLERAAMVTGWGYAVPRGEVVDELQAVRLQVISRETCNDTWDGYITSDMVCAGGRGVDACDGDSGGPAVQDGVQYGIISWGAIECGNGLPAVFTNVAHPSIRGFIRRTTTV